MPGLRNSEGWASGPADYDDEYGYFCELMNGGIERMDEETSALDEHRDSLKKIKLIKLLEEDDDIERIKADVLQARKTVFAVEKFLKEDWNNSLTALREALSGYIKALAEKITLKKIKGKYVIVGTVSGKNLVIAAQLLAELKELEMMIANLEEEVKKMAAHQEIDGFNVEELLDDATKKREKDREEEERDAEKERKRQEAEERRRQKEEEKRRKEEEERLRREEEQRKREEEERRRREEEEARRKAEEEERRLVEEEERQRKEEEERLRREEEERRKKAEAEERKRREEEEKRRKEEEEARRREDERLWKADPRDWPALIYELPHSRDPVGSGVACVIRGPDDYLSLHKDQFVCEFVSWQQNRYRPADNEEVVSSMIRLRPADGVTMKFKTRVWIAIAYAGSSKNRETVIRFQAINGPKNAVSDEQEHDQEPAPEPEPEPEPETETETETETEAQAEAEAGGQVNQEPEQDEAAEAKDVPGEEPESTESGKKNQTIEVQQPDSCGPPAVARVSVSVSTNPVAPVVNEPAPPPEWIDVMMRDTNVTGYETFRFVETPITELDANGINIIVVTRPKTDSDTWNNKGGRLVSSVDSRVSITAPKNAFRLTTDIKLQVIALDSSALNGLKERYDTCDPLIGSSPMLVISMSNKPSKPLAISVTNPSGGGKKPKKDPSGKTLPQSGKPQGRGNGPHDPDDVLSVLVKDVGGKWRHRNSVALDQQRDCVVFQLDGAPQCVIILRTQPGVDSAELGRIAADLETSVYERPAQLVVRQHADNPNLVFIECCRRDTVDKLISGRLQTSQFTDGPDPSRLFVLREGDLVEITFRDNIRAVDGFDGPRQFIFNSNMPTLDLQLNVKEVETYAQNALSVYRGFVRLSLVERAYQPPPRLATTAAGGLIAANRKPPPGVAKNAAADKNMVAEVMLNLPKPNKDRVDKINRMDIGINGPPPLCLEYFDKLAADLGDDWLQLANQLKVAPAAAQRIIRENSNLDEPVLCSQRAARVMLGQWYRSQSKSNQKVEDLKAALIISGRNDLAEDLYTKYKEARLEQDRKLEEIHLKKSIKEFLDESSAVKLWREMGFVLGLNADELEKIGGPEPRLTPRKVVVDAKQARELAQQMLDKWKESAGENATSELLLGSVKKLRLTELAAKISAIRDAT